MMACTKYIASGFFNDAEKLLHEFFQKESVEFPVFAEIWKKHNFVLIFMGRDKYQIRPFTNEVFLITLGFLENPLFYYKVGVFFLLYALFRNQICNPTVLIRITNSQFQVFDDMWNIAIEKKYKNLHYILEYLYKNAFEFVDSAILFGPKTLINPQDYDQHSFSALCLMRETKANMVAFQKSSVLQNLKETSVKYEKMKEKVYSSTNQNVSENYDQYINMLDNLINDRPVVFGPKGSQKQVEQSIGSRRAFLKAMAFKNKANDQRTGDTSDSDFDASRDTGSELAVKRRRKKGKKRGRPKLISNVDGETEEKVPNPKSKKSRSKKGQTKKSCSSLHQFDDQPTVKTVEVSKIETETDESSSS